mgnify:CR=1 FL=1
MTKSDVAALLRCSERTIERQVKLNAFPPPQRFGKEALWFQSIVFSWLEQRREQQQQWVPSQQPVLSEVPAPAVPTPPPAAPQPAKKSSKPRAREWEPNAPVGQRFQTSAA